MIEYIVKKVCRVDVVFTGGSKGPSGDVFPRLPLVLYPLIQLTLSHLISRSNGNTRLS